MKIPLFPKNDIENPFAFDSADEIKEHMLAGKASFTLISKVTNERVSFKVSKWKKNPDLYFVSTLCGAGANYTRKVGYFNINNLSDFRRGRNSDSTFFHVFSWFLNQVANDGNKLDQVTYLPTDNCACCGRRLTVPVSIYKGLGPVCAKRRLEE